MYCFAPSLYHHFYQILKFLSIIYATYIVSICGALTSNLGSFVAFKKKRFFGGRGAGLVAISCVGLRFCLCGFAFYEVGLGEMLTYLHIMPWLESDLFHVDCVFRQTAADHLSRAFML